MYSYFKEISQEVEAKGFPAELDLNEKPNLEPLVDLSLPWSEKMQFAFKFLFVSFSVSYLSCLFLQLRKQGRNCALNSCFPLLVSLDNIPWHSEGECLRNLPSQQALGSLLDKELLKYKHQTISWYLYVSSKKWQLKGSEVLFLWKVCILGLGEKISQWSNRVPLGDKGLNNACFQ